MKALNALNEELFQLQMSEKDKVSEWGVHLLRHLQILPTSFPACYPPDHIAKLKHDYFYGGLHKWLKTIVAYLKATTNERTYLDYLWAVREVKKEEATEISQSSTATSASKLKATSIFPLWKLMGSPPAIPPFAHVAHMEK